MSLGHNSGTTERLRTIIERLEHLDDEKRAIAEGFKDVIAEAKAEGFDAKALRKIVFLRRQDATKRKEEQAIIDLYAHALGFDLF